MGSLFSEVKKELELPSIQQLVTEETNSPPNVGTLWDKQFKEIKEIVYTAGRRILEIRNSGQLISQDTVLQNGTKVRQTNADIEASQYIIERLLKSYPTYGILSQDQLDKDPQWYTKDLVWVVNPIDGTKEFEKGEDDFHIQIALLEKDIPVIGVSYYPAKDMYVWAIKGRGAWLEKEGLSQKLIASPSKENVLLKSSGHKIIESHFEEWKWIPTKINEEPLSSTSRLLKMIQGEASLYISLGASPQGLEKRGGIWNYGANAVIANEAGLILTTLNGHPLNVREPKGLLTEGVVLTNDEKAYASVIRSNWHLE